MKKVFWVLLIIFLFGPVHQSQAQQDDFRKERRRIWKRWKSNRQSYNPYLDKKKKNKPSAVMARENRKELKRQKRAAKKQMRRSRRKVNR